MQLVELVYEGGEILDLCLEAQREVLRAELRERFVTLDLRKTSALERKVALQRAAARMPVVKNVLIRGLSGLLEASQIFTRSSLFLDALGRSELPAPRELSQWAFRTKRVFVYSKVMDAAVREGGIGAISRHNGPYFPAVDFGTDDVEGNIGVVSLGRGVLEVLAQLKRRRQQEGLDFQIVTTEKVADTVRASSALDIAQRCGLLVVPGEEIDNGGPHEGAILAVCTGRVLCTVSTGALYDMPLNGRFLQAAKYERGAYAEAALRYEGIENYAEYLRDVKINPATVPNEILRRV